MPTKRITCNFFYLNEPVDNKGQLEYLLVDQKELINEDKVFNVEVSGVILRFTNLEKKTVNQNDYWIGIIERLDTTEQGEISNLEGEKQIFATEEDEGPIVNTGFIYYPLTNTIGLHKKIGGVNDKMLGVFIRRVLKQTNIVTKHNTKYQLDLIPDLDKITRLKKADSVKTLEYSYKIPEDISSVASEERPMFGDLLLAKYLEGDRIKVKLDAKEMDPRVIYKKVKDILTYEKDNIGSLRAVSEHNHIEEPLDLLSDRLTDYYDVDLPKGVKENEILIMETIDEIFLNQRKLLQKMYLKSEEL
ncbi:hypothetical protein J2R98_000510 [Alkalibacillus filiformis]|uniref:Uncharacterized protein n=1 Tax=Alkalibacillus filiformis TaxID=200990 RepID=A0ABU0DQJ0_9BACI|nr:hypothetical protein [Alkalibacillus filiformis]MDQ0350707.1 hypothetical protein [Alkalibacillus filiformis]